VANGNYLRVSNQAYDGTITASAGSALFNSTIANLKAGGQLWFTVIPDYSQTINASSGVLVPPTGRGDNTKFDNFQIQYENLPNLKRNFLRSWTLITESMSSRTLILGETSGRSPFNNYYMLNAAFDPSLYSFYITRRSPTGIFSIRLVSSLGNLDFDPAFNGGASQIKLILRRGTQLQNADVNSTQYWAYGTRVFNKSVKLAEPKIGFIIVNTNRKKNIMILKCIII
jgi:hypothetical protein